MIKLELWQLLVFIFASIARSRCCLLSRGLDCPPQGAFFGGRIVFKGNRGEVPGLFADLANSRRMMILQTPPVHFRSLMGSGQGRIWIGSKTCRGSDSRLPEQCPWTAGDRPCLDTGIPCETEPPSYAQSSPLSFPEVREDSITVSWPAWDEATDNGIGPVTGYKILYRRFDETFQEVVLDSNRLNYRFDGLTDFSTYQFRIVLVREGEPPEGPPSNIQNVTTSCRELGHVDLNVETMAMETLLESGFNVSWQLPSLTVNCDVTFQQITLHQLDADNCNFSPLTGPIDYVIHTGMRRRSFEELRPNSLYNITYLARNPARTFVTSQLKRTAEGIPTQAPTNLRYQTRRNRVDFFWNIPECGQRNGEVIRYGRAVIVRNGRSWYGRRSGLRHVIRGLNTGDEWLFKVQACNDGGCGPFAEATGVMT